MGGLAAAEVEQFLQRLGERYPHSGTLYLLGGAALCLLGSPRRTVDIDYTLEAPPDKADELRAAIEAVAREMQLELEDVPLEEFAPLPSDASARHRWVGQFGGLAVYVYDPHSIALSKVARGFEADLQDVLFLLRQDLITLEELEEHVQSALPRAWDYDVDPAELRLYLEEIRRRL